MCNDVGRRGKTDGVAGGNDEEKTDLVKPSERQTEKDHQIYEEICTSGMSYY